MTNEMLELAAKVEKAWRWEHVKSDGAFVESLSFDEQRTIVAALRSTAAQADVRDLEQVFVDACDEAGCAHDNEALLQAIADLKRRALPAQGEPVATEQIDAGAQALANDVWHPPQKLENMTGSEANKFRRQARIVLIAALSLV